MDNKIFILGVGHNTPVFINLAYDCGYDVVGLYHYNGERTGEIDHGVKIIGSFDDLFSEGDLNQKCFMLSMGDNIIRAQLSDRILSLNGKIPSMIHPTAVISKFTSIDSVGVYISPFTYVQADTEIGKNSIILSGVNISHTNKIGENCFIAGGSTIGAYTEVEDFVFVGQGVLTISSKVSRIGHHAYIGAGSLLTKSVQPYNVVCGRPAKVIKINND